MFRRTVHACLRVSGARQFRVAFVDLRCRTTNIAGAKEIRMRVLGSKNTVGEAARRQEKA